MFGANVPQPPFPADMLAIASTVASIECFPELCVVNKKVAVEAAVPATAAA